MSQSVGQSVVGQSSQKRDSEQHLPPPPRRKKRGRPGHGHCLGGSTTRRRRTSGYRTHPSAADPCFGGGTKGVSLWRPRRWAPGHSPPPHPELGQEMGGGSRRPGGPPSSTGRLGATHRWDAGWATPGGLPMSNPALPHTKGQRGETLRSARTIGLWHDAQNAGKCENYAETMRTF